MHHIFRRNFFIAFKSMYLNSMEKNRSEMCYQTFLWKPKKIFQVTQVNKIKSMLSISHSSLWVMSITLSSCHLNPPITTKTSISYYLRIVRSAIIVKNPPLITFMRICRKWAKRNIHENEWKMLMNRFVFIQLIRLPFCMFHAMLLCFRIFWMGPNSANR